MGGQAFEVCLRLYVFDTIAETATPRGAERDAPQSRLAMTWKMGIVAAGLAGRCFYLLEASNSPAAPMKKPPVALFSRTTARWVVMRRRNCSPPAA